MYTAKTCDRAKDPQYKNIFRRCHFNSSLSSSSVWIHPQKNVFRGHSVTAVGSVFTVHSYALSSLLPPPPSPKITPVALIHTELNCAAVRPQISPRGSFSVLCRGAPRKTSVHPSGFYLRAILPSQSGRSRTLTPRRR